VSGVVWLVWFFFWWWFGVGWQHASYM